MNIHYLTGYPPRTDTGGGGLANNSLIEEGERRGHTITVYSTPESVPLHPSSSPDLYWLSNMNGVFSRGFLQEATRNWTVPFIVQDDAYQNLCPQPTREYKMCFSWAAARKERITLDIHSSFSQMTYENCHGICRYDFMEELLTKCSAAVFVSPMHAGIWESIFPVIEGKQVIVKPQIRVEDFTVNVNWWTRAPNVALYVGTIARGKGYDNCARLSRALNLELVAAGDIHHTVQQLDVHRWLGHIPYGRLPMIYNAARYFMHLPDTWPEPQGRTVTEALLCGCELLVNWNIGALTYDWLDGILETVDEEVGIRYRHVKIKHGMMNEYRRIISTASEDFWSDLGEYVEGV